MTHGAGISPTGMIREAITSRHDRALATLLARTSHSWKMALDRADVVCAPPTGPGGAHVNLFLRRGCGAIATDLDGVPLIDFCMGDGSLLLGHDHPEIRDALLAQITTGWQFGLPTEMQLVFARLIQSARPANERIALCADGSDATLFAIRAARAATGKDGIGVFAGSRHGTHDYGLVSGEPQASHGLTRNIHLGAGIPRLIDEIASVLPYGHPAAFDLIRRQRNDLAAVIVEPVRAEDPHLDAGPWLWELASVCRKAGVLLIFDELTAGFRLAYGGTQEVFGIEPDLTAYGKVVGGGLPLGVVAGRTEFMRAFGRDILAQGISAAEANAGNALAVAAGTAFLSYANANQESLYPGLQRSTARLSDAFNAAAAALDVPAALKHAGSVFRITLGSPRPRNLPAAAQYAAMDAFAIAALNGGVLLKPGLQGFVSAAHTDTQIDQAAEVFATTLADVKADGFFAALKHR